jgi:hypothetical protein
MTMIQKTKKIKSIQKTYPSMKILHLCAFQGYKNLNKIYNEK